MRLSCTMLKKNHVWDQITTRLEASLSRSEMDIWFSHATLKKIDPQLAVIEVPNKFVASWLSDHYSAQIKKSFKDILQVLPEIRFTFTTPSTGAMQPQYRHVRPPDRLPKPDLNPFWNFDNFITGPSNLFAYSSSLEVAKNPAGQYNPLYLFSHLSQGKTHLLNAVGNYTLAHAPKTRVRYTPCEKYVSEFLTASRERNLQDFRQTFESLELVLFDNIQILSGKEKAQEELAAILDVYLNTKRQVVIAGNRPPNQIKGLLSPLKSRLEWGLIAEIQVPDQKTRRKIIEKRAMKARLNLPEDIIFFLANTTHDVKTLLQHLVGIETHASLYQRKIDMSTVKSLISEQSPLKTTSHDIQRVTAGYFNISLSDLLSNKKKRRYTYPRQMAMYLTRHLTGLSFKEIGKAFGNRDHSTVIYAVGRIEKEKQKKTEIMNDINKLQNFFS